MSKVIEKNIFRPKTQTFQNEAQKRREGPAADDDEVEDRKQEEEERVSASRCQDSVGE
ncbi:hypothetical protein HK100_010772, partial [Physocladia obscura]